MDTNNPPFNADALDLLTPEQVGQMLDCTPETVEQKTRDRELPGVKLGRSWRYPRAAVQAVLYARAMEHAANKPAGGNVVPMPAAKRPTRRTPPPL